MTETFGTAMRIGGVMIFLAILVVVLNSMFALPVISTGGGAEASTQDAFAISGDTTALDGTNISDVEVEQSLGHAAGLSGSANSYVSSDAAVAAPDGNWTVTTWVRVNDTSRDQIIYADAERVLVYNSTNDAFVGVYYNETTGETFRASEVANSPGTWTHLALAREDTQLRLHENNSDIATSGLTAGDAVTTETTAGNLNGTLEETRVFNSSLSSSERQQLVDRPTAPLVGPARASRVMFDSYTAPPGSYPQFFTSGSMSATNVDRVAGFDGEATTSGTDYSRSGDTVTALSGGSLDGAPVLYAAYTAVLSAGGPFAAVLTALQTTGGAALGLVVVGVLALAASRLLDEFGGGGF